MHLTRVILRARSPRTLAQFYVDQLGMTASQDGNAVVLGYEGADASIELRQAESDEPYVHNRTDRYWKIGITLPNVDIAHTQLCRAGITVTKPRQFEDIGYMCHLADPEGFSIELLQHRFLNNRNPEAGDPNKPLGGDARIGQITLRTTNIESALAFYRDQLGMRLLSIQPLKAYGFSLYFLAFTEEQPPNANLEAVENREWLWMRPYTTLELQYLEAHPDTPHIPGDRDPGLDRIVLSNHDDEERLLRDEAGSLVEVIKTTPV